MFWYCERNRKNGFTVTKLLCPDEELFDPVKKLCVFIDTPKNVRADSLPAQNKFKTKLNKIDRGISKYLKSSIDHWIPP